MSVAAASGTLLAIAASLTPAAKGHATHLALGLPPCGWVVSFSKPCPTCGMTTAFAHVANGHVLEAFLTQPFGAFLALATGVAFWAGTHVALTGSNLGPAAARLWSSRLGWGLGLGFIASWLYKVATWNP